MNRKFRTDYARLIAFILLAIAIILVFCYLNSSKEEFVKEPEVKLYLTEKQETVQISLEDYLIGCVAAEMPASFEAQALKAQAICARTYAIRKLINQQAYPMNADLTDNPNNCQAYIDQETFKQRHPHETAALLAKISEAVQSTRGIIITYDGEPIDALYHSTCGGRTESAEEIWGGKIPYLVSVKCENCKASSYYRKQEQLSWKQMRAGLNVNDDKIAISVLATTDSGRIKSLSIEDQKYSGEKFRKLLNLPSVWLKIAPNKNGIDIESRGYGHGVGMCQYGAQGLAKKGNSYKDIISYYYKEVELFELKY